MKWKFLSWESPMAVYYFAKLFGFAPFTLKNGRFYPATLLGKLYPFTLVVATLVTIGFKIFENMSKDDNNWTNIINKKNTMSELFFIGSSMTSSLILIIIILMHKKIVNLLNKLCSMSNELKSLGIVENHGVIISNLFWTAVMTNTVVGTISVTIKFVEYGEMAFLPVLFVIKNVLYSNTILTFAQILLCIKRRFALVNEKLSIIGTTGQNESPHHLRRSSMIMVNQKPREQNQADCSKSLTDLQRIQKIEALHMELCQLLNQCIDIFAAPILLSIFHFLCSLVLFFYWAYFFFFYPNNLSVADYFTSMRYNVLTPMLRISIIIFELFAIARVSVTTCREGNATKPILSMIWNNIESQELQDEIFMFALQLLHTPVTVSAYGFFDLDYSCLNKIFCAVVANLIIMIQFT